LEKNNNSAIAEMVTQGFVSLFAVFEWRSLTLTLPLAAISENIAVSHILPKSRFFGLHFIADSIWVSSSFNQFEVVCPYRILRNNAK